RTRLRSLTVLVGSVGLLTAVLVGGGGTVAASAPAHAPHRGPAPIHTHKPMPAASPRHHAPHGAAPHRATRSGLKKSGTRPLLAQPHVGPTPHVYTVNSTVDSPLNNPASIACVDAEASHLCSLRAAVQAANNRGTVVEIDLGAHAYHLD